MNATPVYLVDASVYIFRAWFSMADEFENERGEPTNAVYGFTGFLCSLLEQTEASHLALAFDESLSTSFRNQIYPDYKANRDPAPEELKRQFAWARAVAESMGIACYSDPEYEADDIIGTLAEYWRAQGYSNCIISSDKDLTQLVGDKDLWWDFARNQKLTSAGVQKKFGVLPEQIADYLALTGDSVDNIPGVPGIGPKSASALLNHFGNLDSLWERLAEVPFLSLRGAKSMHKKLSDNRQAADLARQLTGIYTQVPSVLTSPTVTRNTVDEAGLNRLFDELAFGQLLRKRCLQLD